VQSRRVADQRKTQKVNDVGPGPPKIKKAQSFLALLLIKKIKNIEPWPAVRRAPKKYAKNGQKRAPKRSKTIGFRPRNRDGRNNEGMSSPRLGANMGPNLEDFHHLESQDGHLVEFRFALREDLHVL
jgi:hypothetical protein